MSTIHLTPRQFHARWPGAVNSMLSAVVFAGSKDLADSGKKKLAAVTPTGETSKAKGGWKVRYGRRRLRNGRFSGGHAHHIINPVEHAPFAAMRYRKTKTGAVGSLQFPAGIGPVMEKLRRQESSMRKAVRAGEDALERRMRA